MARLKVFQARLGFHDSVVATTSRPKALAAWGVRQDLFAEGMAGETDDPEAVAAAVAQPETPLLRPVGGKGRFVARPACQSSVSHQTTSTTSAAGKGNGRGYSNMAKRMHQAPDLKARSDKSSGQSRQVSTKATYAPATNRYGTGPFNRVAAPIHRPAAIA